MAQKTSPPVRVAVDTNVPLDLIAERELIMDALDAIRRRTVGASFMVPPSVAGELAFMADHGDTDSDRHSATWFLRHHRALGFQLVNFVPLGPEFTQRVADRVLSRGLLPSEEVHDAFVLAEAALLGCSLLLTSDEHLRSIDFQLLTLELQTFDVVAPVIATPREIVRKFFW